MSSDQWYLLLAIIVVGALIWALSWHASAAWHDKQAARRQLEADKRTAAARRFMADTVLLEQRAPMPTYRGWLFDTAWHPVQRDTAPMSMVDAMDMADAAYRLGESRVLADQAETRAEAEAIWAEVEADPKRWQT